MELVTIVMALLTLVGVAIGEIRSVRKLSDAERKLVVETLLSKSAEALSEDPSCRSDISRPGSMSIAQGIALSLTRASTESRPMIVTADCFDRTGYPRSEGQEWCRVALVYANKRRSSGFGLIFRMDWKASDVVPGSAECYGFD